MNVLVIGSGGREHAICWKISQSKKLKKLFCAPGNPGIAGLAENVNLKVDDINGLIAFAKSEKIDLTIVGPEYPLSLGIVDAFKKEKLRIFGPSKAAAQIEASKHFAKQIMLASNVKTAASEVFSDLESAKNYLAKHELPVVLKADGLAAGKGVFICHKATEIEEALNCLFTEMKVEKLLVESFLEGKEVSFIVATDGKQIVPLAAAHDYKRIFDNDQGLNTGGMGNVSPTPNLPDNSEVKIIDTIMRPVIDTMAKQGVPFQGFLYAGLMISPKGEINILEFNARLGDPETQVIMRRMDADFLAVLDALCSDGQTKLPEVSWKKQSAVCVVLASGGYPLSNQNDEEIFGIDLASQLPEVVIFHAGTKLQDDKLVTNGGRVLNVTALGDTQEIARSRVYQAADMIQFKGRQIRRDIAK